MYYVPPHRFFPTISATSLHPPSLLCLSATVINSIPGLVSNSVTPSSLSDAMQYKEGGSTQLVQGTRISGLASINKDKLTSSISLQVEQAHVPISQPSASKQQEPTCSTLLSQPPTAPAVTPDPSIVAASLLQPPQPNLDIVPVARKPRGQSNVITPQWGYPSPYFVIVHLTVP